MQGKQEEDLDSAGWVENSTSATPGDDHILPGDLYVTYDMSTGYSYGLFIRKGVIASERSSRERDHALTRVRYLQYLPAFKTFYISEGRYPFLPITMVEWRDIRPRERATWSRDIDKVKLGSPWAMQSVDHPIPPGHGNT